MTSAPESPAALVFPDRRLKGRFPVKDVDGAELAFISTPWTGSSFTVVDPYARPLCTGTARWGGLSGTWRSVGNDGEPILVVRRHVLRTAADIELPRDCTTYRIRGSAWRRNFAVLDSADREIARAVPRTSAISPRQHDYEVRQIRPVFRLDEMIALVQSWRMLMKADAHAAGGAVAAVSVTG
jgi:hypothetical protein